MASGEELHEYIGFAGRQRRDTALHVLDGFLEGVEMDHVINPQEHRELRDWIYAHERLADKDRAFRELLVVLHAAIADRKLEPDEVADLRALCQRARSDSQYYDAVVHAIQELHGILHGLVADLTVNQEEVEGLQDWIERNGHLRQVWPVTEVESVIVKVMSDRKIDEPEHRMMLHYFSEFAQSPRVARSLPPLLPSDLAIAGVCATDPQIFFVDRMFCFTGISSRGPRQVFAEAVTRKGGIFIDTMKRDVDYLVIGDEGNPCWAFSCYGRKVEKAVEMRRSGHSLLIVHERDFWDAAG